MGSVIEKMSCQSIHLLVAVAATAVAVAVAASGRPAALSAPAAMAVQRAQQVAAGES